MSRILIFLVLFLSSFNSKDSLPDLRRDLKKAQQELVQAQRRVKKLEEAIAYQEILQIEKEVKKIKPEEVAKFLLSEEQGLNFFSAQRETLISIIHNDPACATQAQEVLDQILTLITLLSDRDLD